MAIHEPVWCPLMQLDQDRMTYHRHIETLGQEIGFEKAGIEIGGFGLGLDEGMRDGPVQDDFEAEGTLFGHADGEFGWFFRRGARFGGVAAAADGAVEIGG